VAGSGKLRRLLGPALAGAPGALAGCRPRLSAAGLVRTQPFPGGRQSIVRTAYYKPRCVEGTLEKTVSFHLPAAS